MVEFLFVYVLGSLIVSVATYLEVQRYNSLETSIFLAAASFLVWPLVLVHEAVLWIKEKRGG